MFMAKIINPVSFKEAFNAVSLEAEADDLDSFDRDYPDGFRWVQTVITNDPLEGKQPESVDPGRSKLPEPFYYRYLPNVREPGKFDDTVRRSVPAAGKTTEWNATLTLVAVDLKHKWMEAHDIRTYGFKLSLRKGMRDVGNVELVYPKPDWHALGKHAAIVKLEYPAWTFSLLKWRPTFS